MRRLVVLMVVLGVAAMGCNNPRGPATGPSGHKPGGDLTASDTFSLKGSWMSESLKQGESKEVKISLSKGTNFKQDVQLTFEPEKGLKVEPSKAVIKASEPSGEVAVKVTAEPDAPVGTLHIMVKTDPPTDKALDLTVKVQNK